MLYKLAFDKFLIHNELKIGLEEYYHRVIPEQFRLDHKNLATVLLSPSNIRFGTSTKNNLALTLQSLTFRKI